MEIKGIHSIRGLAAKAGISPQTAKRVIDGTGDPSFETITAIADALYGGDREPVYALLGDRRQVDHGPWQLPEEVTSQLDEEQRAAVLAVARAMLPADVRKRGEHGGDTAPTKDHDFVVYDGEGNPMGAGEMKASAPIAARRVGKPSPTQRAKREHDEVGEENQDH